MNEISRLKKIFLMMFQVISLEDNSEQKTFLSDQGLVGSENMTKLVRALHRMFTVRGLDAQLFTHPMQIPYTIPNSLELPYKIVGAFKPHFVEHPLYNTCQI